MKSTTRTKEFLVLENLAIKNNTNAEHQLKTIHEDFVIPYVNYLNNLARVINESQLTSDQIQKLFQTVTSSSQASGNNETTIGKLLPDSIKQKFANTLPGPTDGTVSNFETQANTTLEQVKDPTTKRSLLNLVKQGIQNPLSQKLIIAGIQGIAGVTAGALSGGIGGVLGASAAGAISGGLLGVVTAKIQGQDWKTAGIAGLKGAAIGGAAGAAGGILSGANSDNATTVDSQKSQPTQQPLEFPAELTSGSAAADLKAAQEYALADQAEKAEIRNVTGLTDQQLSNILLQQKTMNKESVSNAANYLNSTASESINKSLTVQFWALNESLGRPIGGVQLTEAGIKDVIDTVKAWAKTKGNDLTQKVTVNKLIQAWATAGNPTDSEKIYQLLKDQGIPSTVIDSVYQSLKIPSNVSAAAPTNNAMASMASQLTKAPASNASKPMASMASQLTKAPNTVAAPSNTSQAALPAASAPVTGTVFDDPAKLVADFNSYINAGGRVSPQFINVLKNALLTKFNVVEQKNKKTVKESRVAKFKKLFEIQNQPMEWLLCESAAGKNAHLEHLEDLILDAGYDGASSAFTYLDGIRTMLSKGAGNPSKVTTKWDGAPAIVCGIDPEDGKFFLGTKSVFAKDAKLIKSNKDVDQYYSDKPGLSKKLKYALKYLPELGIGNVLQGDLMFIDEDLGTATINDEECYVFTPNTITYAVPVNSKLGVAVRSAKLGIVFHTAYEGTSLPEMTATFGVSVAGLNTTRNVWVDDATYKDLTGRATLTPAEDSALVNAISAGQKTLAKITKKKFDIIVQNVEFTKFIKPFINNNVRSGEQVGDPLTFLKKFIEFYSEKQNAEIAKLKGGVESKAAQARIAKIQEQQKFMADNSNTLLGIMAIYKKVIELKLAILRKLQQVESLVGTFIKTENGYKVVNPEGFVAIGHDGGAVKLVDRLEFSRQNFAGTQDWKRRQITSD